MSKRISNDLYLTIRKKQKKIVKLLQCGDGRQEVPNTILHTRIRKTPGVTYTSDAKKRTSEGLREKTF